MATPYGAARLKLNRAKKHTIDAQTAIVALENAYAPAIEQHPDTGAQSLIHDVPDTREPIENLSLVIGDAIHNLRSALDYAWYATIERLLPDKLSRYTSFPIRKKRKDVENCLRGIEVDTRCKPLFDCVLSDIQPYEGGNNSSVLYILHELDITDKHLLSLGLSRRRQIRGITTTDKEGRIWRGSTLPFQDLGTGIIRFEAGITIQDKGKLSVAVSLEDAGVFKTLPVVVLLQMFRGFVVQSVELLERL